MSGLESWRGFLANELKDRKTALARARQAVVRTEQIQLLLAAERERRDAVERERRGHGEMPDFASERMNVLLERAIERAAEKVTKARGIEAQAAVRVREAWQKVKVVERLLERRRERAALEERRGEQKELDEVAARRHFRRASATPAPGDERS